MISKNLYYFLLGALLLNCKEPIKKKVSFEGNTNQITCTDRSCYGSYYGPEFIKGSDIAHQFSNKMSAAVGDNLKRLYDLNQYAMVDFSKIEMSTFGMGSGVVDYKLVIPIKSVKAKCDAYTSFDHVGGWNHTPELQKRKQQLRKALLDGEQLDISNLKTTKEGLQEYWIQWKHKSYQIACE